MSKETLEVLEQLTPDKKAMWLLIQVGKCCGKECARCPYISADGEPHVEGSRMHSAGAWELVQEVKELTKRSAPTSAD